MVCYLEVLFFLFLKDYLSHECEVQLYVKLQLLQLKKVISILVFLHIQLPEVPHIQLLSMEVAVTTALEN